MNTSVRAGFSSMKAPSKHVTTQVTFLLSLSLPLSILLNPILIAFLVISLRFLASTLDYFTTKSLLIFYPTNRIVILSEVTGHIESDRYSIVI